MSELPHKKQGAGVGDMERKGVEDGKSEVDGAGETVGSSNGGPGQ